MDAIVDNQRRKVGDFLRHELDSQTNLSVVSAYFTIYAYHDLRQELDAIAGMRFLYGEPCGVDAMDPDAGAEKAFRLTNDGGIELRRVLTQKPLARACEAWIRQKVKIRTIRKSNFLHGKLYFLAGRNGKSTAVLGSSNLTRRGLGLGANPNIELNLQVVRDVDRGLLLNWFNAIWDDHDLTRDAKDDVLAALARLGKDYGPEFVYYKTLFHVLEDRLATHEENQGIINKVDLHDTEIWKALFSFQRDGAVSAINRLTQHNGCIIADSVGLGKTFTALAVIKFFEIRNERVLVLCPKKLEQNWIRFASWAGQANNPFVNDRFGYTVLAHTDLSRFQGISGNIDLASFNWGGFDLVVIDESHNFRNEGRDRRDENGRIIARSRYGRLLEEVIKAGARTKVLMLSATPVNTSLCDLRNQIYLMTEKQLDRFNSSLGISNIQSVFRLAQQEFLKWEKESEGEGTRKKEILLDRLGPDFLAILDAVSIARSRNHVRRWYTEVEQKVGGFPTRAAPMNLHPATDCDGQLSYDNLHERISQFRLAVYMPSQYLKDVSVLEEEKARSNFDQRIREHWLVCMMRVNLLKRLESSVHSFTLTMGRILEKINRLDQRIEGWLTNPAVRPTTHLVDNNEEFETYKFGKSRSYRLSDLDLHAWRNDLKKDHRTLSEIHDSVQQVGVKRDAKLAKLRAVIERKVKMAPVDKDGIQNRKVLVFTTFADTAGYVYENLEEWVQSTLGIHIGLVTGSDGNRCTVGSKRFSEILTRFAPKGQQASTSLEQREQIDILIATDCLSEGQNLQDCDFVINYDIHWNPVRLMQRFGRIDRIGSRNHQVSMVNFWPTEDLDRYLDLRNRVEARMTLVDAAGTGQDDLLGPDAVGSLETVSQYELGFRGRQLRRIREECLDIEELDDGVTVSDFTLDDFIAELIEYLQSRRAELEAAPYGICGVVPPSAVVPSGESSTTGPGVIFCLRHRTSTIERTPNRLNPYFLAYVRVDGTVRYSFPQAKQILSIFRSLASGHAEPITDLVASFDRETKYGQEMGKYEHLLAEAIRKIRGGFRRAQLRELARGRGARVSRQSEIPQGSEDFELVTWLVITDAT